MLQLTKRQIKTLLEVISKDDSREVLTTAYIDTYNDKPVLVATDSYHLVALALDDSALPEVGKFITRDDLTRWYKLATTKDFFTEAAISELAKTIDYLKYPEWQRLVPSDDEANAEMTSMMFNADLMVRMQVLSGQAGLKWELYGALRPMVARGDAGTFLVMPLKR